MDCSEALEWLEARDPLPSADPGADDDRLWDDCLPEIQAARQHLSDCSHCQQALPVSRAWDHSLATVMKQVEIPPGLRARLLADLAVAESPSPAPALSSEPAPRVLRTRRRRWWIAACSICTVCLMVMVSTIWWNAAPPMSVVEIYGGVDAEYAALPDFRHEFEPLLPAAWSSVFTLDPGLVRGFPATGVHAGRAALVPFQMASRSGKEPLRGRLLMLSTSQLAADSADSLPNDFSEAEVRYLPEGRGAYLVWREDDLVYVCLMSSGPADLHRFQRALTGLRSLT